MVVRHDAQLPPAIHDGQQTEVVVLQLALRHLPQAEPVQQVVPQQQLLALGLLVRPAKYGFPRCVHAPRQLRPVPREHQLEQLRHGLGVLLDLLAGVGVEDGEAGIDVPFVGVDAQGDVDLDVLDATNVAGRFPWELVVGGPRGAHAEEGGVGHGLGVGGDAVVLLACEVDVLGLQAREDVLHEGKVCVRGAVFDQHEGLAFRVDARPVEGVARYDADIGGEVLLKGFDFGGFAGRLTANNGTDLGGCSRN